MCTVLNSHKQEIWFAALCILYNHVETVARVVPVENIIHSHQTFPYLLPMPDNDATGQ
jgi:hypothetical protein